MNFFAFLTDAATNGAAQAADAATQATETTPLQGFLAMLPTLGMFAVIILVFYFLLIRPQKKQEKQTTEMRNSIQEGDVITTIGGMTGTVRQIKGDDEYVIETGADKSKITIKKWAIQSKDTISN